MFRKSTPKAASNTDETLPNDALVDCGYYERGSRQGSRLSIAEAAKKSKMTHDGFVWVGLHEPTAEQIAEIAAEFDLHPLAVEDAVHAHQRPKLEIYSDTVFMVLKTVNYVDHDELIEVGEIMVFLSSKFIITVRHGEALSLSEVRQKLESNHKLIGVGPSAVLYAITDHVVDEYSNVITGLAEDIEDIETQVFNPAVINPSERIYRLKREVLAFHRAVEPLATAIERLSVETFIGIDARTMAYFRDVHDHVLRDVEAIQSFQELLSSALQANVAQITLRLNEDMRKFTAWAAIFAVVTAIAGIYGMNFEHMPELHWRYGYPLVLTLIATICIAMITIFRRRKWI